MHSHGPSCLSGPVSRARSWWTNAAPAGAPVKKPRPGRRRARTMKDNHDTPPQGDEIRTDLVERVRREIAAGVYETPEKWDIALQRLLERLERDED
jgi:hypothetical protein